MSRTPSKLRTKGKISNEAYREPDSYESHEMKKALNTDLPTEVSFYLVDAVHDTGTNRYTFQFPQEWRTLASNSKILGVREIILKSSPKIFSGVLYIKDNESILGTVYEYHFNFVWRSDSTVYDFISYLQKRFIINSSSEVKPSIIMDEVPKINHGEEIYGHIALTFYIENNSTRYSLQIKMNADLQEFFNIDSEFTPIKYSLTFNIWRRSSDLIVKSSLVSDDKNKHLGVVNTQYRRLKYFKIPENESTFYIELFSSDLTKRIELAPGGMDYLIIEGILLTGQHIFTL